MYYATYQDNRDPDESAIIEAETIDIAVLGVFEYFARVLDAWAHCVVWYVRDGVNGPIIREEYGPAERS